MWNLFGHQNGASSGRTKKVGLLAGWGDLPEILARALKKRGAEVVVVAVERDRPDPLEALAGTYEAVHVGEGGKALQAFKAHGVRQVLLIGKVPKKKIHHADFQADDFTRNVLSKLKLKGDANILKAIKAVLRLNGIRVLRAGDFLTEELTPRGLLTKRTLSEQEARDVRCGFKTAKAIGRMDIGQTVAVRGGTIVAVEAMEGTDETIRRIGKLGAPGVVIVKVSHPGQDLALDIPVVGEDTLQLAHEAGCTVLALEAGRSLMVRRKDMLARADALGLSVMGV